MNVMRFAVPIAAWALLSIPIANGAETSVIKIVSPTDRAQINAEQEYSLIYEVALGPGGNHFHVWVDDKRGPGVRDLNGTYLLPALSPGEHVITLRIVDRQHSPTGVEKSIRLTAK